ncbi:MAG: sugar phosphate isomerase/epimerase family protein [Armatimonadaceae bacterium]
MERVALQLYSVRDDLLQDPAKAIDRVREIGFATVEAMYWPDMLPIASLASCLDQSGIGTCSLHVPLPNPENIASLADAAGMLGTREVVWHGWPRDPRHNSMDGVLELASIYRDAAELAAQHGMHLSLHNHWWEFQPIPDSQEMVRPIDVWMPLLADSIGYELDTYWIAVAGANPVDELKALAASPRLIHLKDGPGNTDGAKTPLGTGILPLADLAETISAETWKIVEMDDCDSDLWIALEQSHRTLIGYIPHG